jgi:hypothetical protein
MFGNARWIVTVLLVSAAPAWAAPAKYAVKIVKEDPPGELKEPIRKLLDGQSVQLLDGTGTVLAQVWLRKEVPATVTDQQIKNGLTYRDLKETTILGAIRFPKTGSDYRKQKVPAGVYTMRLGFQPMDGDHMGVSAHQEFCLLIAAAKDTNPDPMKLKTAEALSTKSIRTTHPAVFMLFPNEKPKADPELVSKGNNHWVLNVKGDVKAGTKKAMIGIGLTLIGHAD